MRVKLPKQDSLRKIVESSSVTRITPDDVLTALEIANHANSQNSIYPNRDFTTKFVDALCGVCAERCVLEADPTHIKRGPKKGHDLEVAPSASVLSGLLEIKTVKDNSRRPYIIGQTYDWKIVFQREGRDYEKLLAAVRSEKDIIGMQIAFWAPKIYHFSEPTRPIILDFCDEGFST